MDLGISTACFYPLPIEQGIEKIAELGFRQIEIFVNTESEFSKEYIAGLRRQTSALGLTVVSVHPYTSAIEGLLLFTEYARRTQDALSMYHRYFEQAASLGARYMTFHGERAVSLNGMKSQTGQHKIEIYGRLCDLAKQYDMVLAQENVAWCKSRDPAYLRELHDKVPDLGFTLDLKQARRADTPWEDYLDAVEGKLVNLHINDYNAEQTCLLPGRGVVDYAALFRALQQAGYHRQAILEVYSGDYTDYKELKESGAYLKKFLPL